MASDRRGHRIVTGISLLGGIAIFLAARAGMLGESAARFSTAYLVFLLVLVGARAALTELGVRRPRLRYASRVSRETQLGKR